MLTSTYVANLSPLPGTNITFSFFSVAAERDFTADLAGLLERVNTEHHAAITDPRRSDSCCVRSIASVRIPPSDWRCG